MDITKLKNYVKSHLKMIIASFSLILALVLTHIYVNSYNVTLALSYINEDLLERSIDESYYIVNKELVFDELKLKENIDYLFTTNKINVDYSVKVNKNRCIIKIANKEKEYEISKVSH